MSPASIATPARAQAERLWPWIGVLALGAVLLTLWRWQLALPAAQWWAAALDPAPLTPSALVFHFSLLPRGLTALLAGAGLGLAGALFQQTLRNPLASPTTLGAESAAQLALTLALILAPGWLAGSRETVTLAGAGAAVLVVFACAARAGFSSVGLILAGLVTGLFCSALSVALRLLNKEYVSVLFLWGGGSLAQQDWSAPAFLAPRLAGLVIICWLARRALDVLSLDDDSARAVGVPLVAVRGFGLVLGVFATAVVTASVGVIGFLGLAAPQIARLLGARRFSTRLVAAPLVGAFVLLAVDALVGMLEARGVNDLPTGAATALLGAPLLLWLLPRLRRSTPPEDAPPATTRLRASRPILAGLLVVLLAGLLAALVIGRTGGATIISGWHLATPDTFGLVAPWRVPRNVLAMLAGGMLGAAGLMLQRLTGNPLAAPEVLGIGTGVTAGVIAALLISTAPSLALQTTFGAVGALAVMALILLAGRRTRFAPEHMLLTGLALSALLDVVVVAFLALNDPRAAQVLSWIAGSTYTADWRSVAVTGALAALLLPLALLIARWLDILPLGELSARALGLPLAGVRLAVMGLAALLTSAAVLVAGPLTFVGLVGPHLARLLGLRRAAAQITGAALLGGAVMAVADLLGRTVIAPRQLPAGLVAALIGLPYLVTQLGRRRA